MNRIILAILAFHFLFARAGSAAQTDWMDSFDSTAKIEPADSHVRGDIDPSAEKFYVHVPKNYDGSEPFGLIVYIYPNNEIKTTPIGWEKVLEQRKLLFIAPQNAGNDQTTDRRLGLALMAVKGMQQKYKIDPQRIYAAGVSGGARMAGRLGYYASDVFKGTIQSCGADFYRSVPKVDAVPAQGDNPDQPYGLIDTTDEEAAAAKKNIRFVLITGSKDFRAGYIHDIYHGGFEKEGFQAKLIDVPGMPHTDCPPFVLTEALNFIEGIRDIAATSQPAAPAWMARDPERWPQILLTNQFHYADGSGGSGASGCLLRLPNGVVVGATAKHVIGEGKLTDLKQTLLSWALSRPGSPGDHVVLKQLAEKIPDGDTMDWFVMTPVSQQGPWPAEPLPVRTEPLEIGDMVYLLAVPEGDQSRQHVYQGTVIGKQEDGSFTYAIPSAPNSRGFSGAPIIDASGRLAGLHTSHTDVQGQYGGIETASLLPIIQLPPDVLPVPSSPAAIAGQTASSGASQSPVQKSDEASAASPAAPSLDDQAEAALRGAQLLIDNKIYDKAKARLQELIEAFPNTPAAEKAKKMLSDIENQ